MKRIAAALLVLTVASPALALEYNCSPITGGCVPISSQPSYIDGPSTWYVPPQQRIWLRGCRVWDCSSERDHQRRRDRAFR